MIPFNNSEPVTTTEKPSDIFLKHTPQRCPTGPISTFDSVGRLGNIFSSYANYIAIQWELGYKLHLPTKAYRQLTPLLRNVSFPTAQRLKKCKIKNWYKQQKLEVFYKDLKKCMKTGMTKQQCLPSFNGQVKNIKISPGHNVIMHFSTNIPSFIHQALKWTILKDHIQEVISKHFQFRDSLMRKVLTRIRSVTSKMVNLPLIGVHVRRTDYAAYRQHKKENYFSFESSISESALRDFHW